MKEGERQGGKSREREDRQENDGKENKDGENSMSPTRTFTQNSLCVEERERER